MKKTGTTLLTALILLHYVFGQNGQPAHLMKENRIKTVEGFIFKTNESSDSTLITVEQFNAQGRRTNIEIRDSAGLKGSYEYIYEQNDTVKTERRTYDGTKLSSITKITNDAYGNELKCVDFDGKGHKMGLISISKYNKQQYLADYKMYIQHKLVVHTKYSYHKNGNKKQVKKLIPKNHAETVNYDENGRQLNTDKSTVIKTEDQFENYNNAGKMTRTTLVYSYTARILGLADWLDLKPTDNLVTEHYFKANGLLDYELQYLNGVFIAKKKYKYTVGL